MKFCNRSLAAVVFSLVLSVVCLSLQLSDFLSRSRKEILKREEDIGSLVRRDLSIYLLEIDIRNRKQGSEEIFWGMEGGPRKVIPAVANLPKCVKDSVSASLEAPRLFDTT
ncbi:hypothetical protein AVEN_216458-1 [Araneus ventricosus]|uniref:Uncharacterized protein n=1 Tax=Araneus ventricosus TaxID=182803 RepID=A0A4Y2BNU0_ARAVE|nr:hypothetical protein AVEN_216458-1 [Araneus ventricosus]